MIEEMADPFAFFKKILLRIAPHAFGTCHCHTSRPQTKAMARAKSPIHKYTWTRNKYSEIHPMRDQDSD
jgi:hypothetical protein